MFPMGGTHLVELGFQLAHVALHFLDGGSIGKDKEKRFKIPILHISASRLRVVEKRRTLPLHTFFCVSTVFYCLTIDSIGDVSRHF